MRASLPPRCVDRVSRATIERWPTGRRSCHVCDRAVVRATSHGRKGGMEAAKKDETSHDVRPARGGATTRRMEKVSRWDGRRCTCASDRERRKAAWDTVPKRRNAVPGARMKTALDAAVQGDMRSSSRGTCETCLPMLQDPWSKISPSPCQTRCERGCAPSHAHVVGPKAFEQKKRPKHVANPRVGREQSHVRESSRRRPDGLLLHRAQKW
mmetsp:Transcript_10915/g.67430  ORF Transcript_10915/g.67430 Transcript_10915/m.67430 type:complete len:211 (+) Transcript_10915:3698-4330(+)